jgi:hypothetical protein
VWTAADRGIRSAGESANAGGYGRWAFAKLRDVYDFEVHYAKLVEDLFAAGRPSILEAV